MGKSVIDSYSKLATWEKARLHSFFQFLVCLMTFFLYEQNMLIILPIAYFIFIIYITMRLDFIQEKHLISDIIERNGWYRY
jgi:hypothetical protein